MLSVKKLAMAGGSAVRTAIVVRSMGKKELPHPIAILRSNATFESDTVNHTTGVPNRRSCPITTIKSNVVQPTSDPSAGSPIIANLRFDATKAIKCISDLANRRYDAIEVIQ
ncbi:hypothetical protein E2562_035679 [Oryza meyeriana var. granulata]|uniref:Uncharacterized protein n=1 Tax=Oryza meyeriana var. granulata TaxID=110450 RepID=A0A6G1CYK5_9ORYZ|nr:hypothetical protein E2562_035679 [Oryza meyeriana var. granulata]